MSFDTLECHDQNVFNPKLSEFVCTELLEREISETFDNEIVSLDTTDQFFEAKKNSFEIERKKQLDSVDSMKSKKKKCHKKDTIKDVDVRIFKSEKEPKRKSVIEFNTEYACSIKALSVKETSSIKLTTRFFSGKMLMFAKLSLKSFIYELIETFVFPNEKTKKIYEKCQIEYAYVYHILTDTDSTSVKFLFVCAENNKLPDPIYRDVIFGVVSSNKIIKRFDTSHPFWEAFQVRDETLQKKCGYYEIEHIDDLCYITIAVNPREYIEKFLSEKVNKKHKGLKKGSSGMDIQNFGKRINSVRDIDNFGQLPQENLSQFRFVIKNNKMNLQEVNKSRFAQANDERYYFADIITLLPFSHPNFLEIGHYKSEKKERVERYIIIEKQKFLNMEKKGLLKNHRLFTLQSIYLQWPEYRNLNSDKRGMNNDEQINFGLDTRSFILNGFLR